MLEQGVRVKKLEAINKKLESAKTEKSKLKLEAEKSLAEAGVQDGKFAVQDAAINMSIESNVVVATEILPEVKVKRKTWKFEVVDIIKTQKEKPEWVHAVLMNERVKEYLNEKKIDGKNMVLRMVLIMVFVFIYIKSIDVKA